MVIHFVISNNWDMSGRKFIESILDVKHCVKYCVISTDEMSIV